MKTIILGREGDQPFRIADERSQVSRRHAELTMTDGGEWYLKDLNSPYGTYVRDEESGNWIRIGNNQRINQMTYIKLGGDRGKSCCFFAKQIVNPGQFQKEYHYLVGKKQEFDIQLKQIEQFKNWLNIGKIVISVICLGVFALYFADNVSAGANGAIIRMALISIVPPAIVQVIQSIYNPTKRINEIKEKRKKFLFCPNPACGRKLTDDEIEAGTCGKCKK